jgi:hypothetical protein
VTKSLSATHPTEDQYPEHMKTSKHVTAKEQITQSLSGHTNFGHFSKEEENEDTFNILS